MATNEPWLIGQTPPNTKREYKAIGITGQIKDGLDVYKKKWEAKLKSDWIAAEEQRLKDEYTYTAYKTGETVVQDPNGGLPPKAIKDDPVERLEWAEDQMKHNYLYNTVPEYRDEVQINNGGSFFSSDKLKKWGDFAVDTATTVAKGGAILGSAYGANALTANLQGIPMGAAAGTGVPASNAAAGFTDPSGMGVGGTVGANSSAPMASNAMATTGGLKTAQVGVPGSVNGASTMGAGPAAASTGAWSPAAGTATTAAGATAATTAGMNAATSAAGTAGGNALANASDWINPALIAGSSLVSGYLANDAADDATDEIRRQYDQNRADMEPWRQAGVNALADYQEGINQPNNMYGEFTNNSLVPQYQNTTAPPPEYMDRSRFDFNMEEDEGYKFTRDQALQATDRMSRAGNGAFSVGQATALQDRAGGVASQWSDMYRRAALGESQANYGRSMAEYNADTSRNQDIYGRGVQDYSLARQGNLDQYGRDVGQYSMGVARNTDDYNRTQNTLNRQQGLAGLGQTTMAGLGNQGASAANNIANINIGAAGATNAAIQGGMSNYLSYQDQQNNPGVPAWMRGRTYS